VHARGRCHDDAARAGRLERSAWRLTQSLTLFGGPDDVGEHHNGQPVSSSHSYPVPTFRRRSRPPHATKPRVDDDPEAGRAIATGDSPARGLSAQVTADNML
jgi:hypothetical protein